MLTNSVHRLIEVSDDAKLHYYLNHPEFVMEGTGSTGDLILQHGKECENCRGRLERLKQNYAVVTA